MRAQIASDLHLDILENRSFDGFRLQVATEAEVFVLAVDIDCGTYAVDYFERWPVPVAYVSGNHEAFGLRYASVIDRLRALSAGPQVRCL